MISSSKINLNFLRKANNDTETTRTIEIPACNGFMLAEASEEQKKLFKENEEAVFFYSKKDLLEKIKYYLTNDDKRNMIAARGFKKCIISEYNYDKQIKEILYNLYNY